MAVIKPFRALRPEVQAAPVVASVPYDVVDRSEAKEYAKDNQLSFLRVTRSEIEFDDSVSAYSPEIYSRAKENLDKLIKNAPLVTDEKPHFYLYKLVMDGRAQVGIAATFSVDDYDNDVIMKHEKTRKEKEDDRTNHIITTEAQTGVVFLTYKGSEKINEAVNKTMQDVKPLYSFTAPDGIEHDVWIMPDEYNQLITDEIAKTKNLYIADGHHRAASASRARKAKQDSNPSHKGDEEYNYFIAVLFPAEQLKILPYNRVIKDLNGLSKDELLNKISEKFTVEKTSNPMPSEEKTYCMYIDNEWYLLKPQASVKAGVSLSKSVAETLDVSVLQDFLLTPVIGIGDVRTDKRIDFVGGIRGTKELERLVNSGKAAAAFSVYPVSVDDLMNISDAGEIMPPKSTWFEPKLRDGLLIHLIK
jgi:uncharacterized protein (DUF1015 family)